jgi:hypothetical protein
MASKKKFTTFPGEKKFVLLSRQRDLPPLLVKMIKKTPVGVTVTIDADYKKNDRSKTHLPNGFYTLQGDRIHLTTTDPHVLAHELGHARNDEEALGRIIQSRYLYPLMNIGPLAGYVGGAALREAKHPVAKAIAIGVPFLLTLPGMAAEAKASINGHHILRELGASEKELEKYRAKMIKYYMSYAVNPALTGLSLVAGRYER